MLKLARTLGANRAEARPTTRESRGDSDRSRLRLPAFANLPIAHPVAAGNDGMAMHRRARREIDPARPCSAGRIVNEGLAAMKVHLALEPIDAFERVGCQHVQLARNPRGERIERDAGAMPQVVEPAAH